MLRAYKIKILIEEIELNDYNFNFNTTSYKNFVKLTTTFIGL